MKSTPDASLGKASPRWLRFRLRTLLVFMVLLSLPLSWLGNALYRIRRQRTIVAEITAAGGRITFEHEQIPKGQVPKPPGPEFTRRFVGDDAFTRVIEVHLPRGFDAIIPGGKTIRGGNDADLGLIAELSTIERLHLDGPSFTDAGIVHIAKLSALQGLHLSDTRITAAGLARLSSLEQLTGVTLSGSTAGDEVTPGLANLRQIRSVRLSRADLTSQGLAPLSDLRSLRIINISFAPGLGDEGLAHLASLNELWELHTFETSISDRGLIHLCNLSSLNALGLAKCEVSSAGCEEIAKLPVLRTLSLAHTHVDDEGLVHLARIQELTHLNLIGTQVTDEGLQHLAALQKLQSLYVSPPVTVEGASRLKRQLPPNCYINLEITYPKRQVNIRVP